MSQNRDKHKFDATKLFVNGVEIRPGDRFKTLFQRSYKGSQLYFIARSDTGIIIMPESGSHIYSAAARYNIVEAECELKQLKWTQRNTCFAIVRVVSFTPVL
jgi:hypothetical protein